MSEMNCPDCGADCSDGRTCTDHFHMMLFWELDHQLWDVHHLMVLSYHIQHPSLYSPDGLAFAQGQLVDFLEKGISPQQMRQKISKQVNSGMRDFKIKGTVQSHGSYEKPIQWSMNCADVVAAGMDNYYASVRKWAQSILDNLRESGNL